MPIVMKQRARTYFLAHRGQPVALPEDFIPGLRSRLRRINEASGAANIQKTRQSCQAGVRASC
jgi:hypothetical protein